MKLLNEILIEWDNSKIDDNGIISQEDVNTTISSLPYEEWKNVYLTDEIPEEWTLKSDPGFSKTFKRRFSIEDKIGIFQILYEIFEPYTKKFLNVAEKMIDKALIDRGLAYDTPLEIGYLGTLNYIITYLFFKLPPREFNPDSSKELYNIFRKNYFDYLSEDEREVLKSIWDKGHSGADFYNKCREKWQGNFTVVIDMMPFIKKFGKYNIERNFF